MLIIDVIGRDGRRHISRLEDPLGTGLRGKHRDFLRLTGEDGDGQSHGKLHVIVIGLQAWHDIGLACSPALNDLLNTLQSLGRKQEGLGKTEMLREFYIVLRDYNVESLVCGIYFHQFKDLKIVFVNIVSEGEGTHIDYIDIRVLHREYASYLRVLLLFEFLHGKSLELTERVRVNVYLDAFLLLDFRPFDFELFLHFPPDLERFFLEFFHSQFGRFLQLVESVSTLDDGRLLH